VDLDNTQLLNSLYEAAARVMYYETAKNRQEEVGPLAAAHREWELLRNEAAQRGIYNRENFKGYRVPL
jgi:hypothetical protein